MYMLSEFVYVESVRIKKMPHMPFNNIKYIQRKRLQSKKPVGSYKTLHRKHYLQQFLYVSLSFFLNVVHWNFFPHQTRKPHLHYIVSSTRKIFESV